MNTYISILRGINVSGAKMIKMDTLRKLYEELGFQNVRTYIQSGNVIFDTKKTNPKHLEKSITEKIVEAYAFHVPVLVKDKEELKIVLQNNPFLKKRKEDVNFLHVTFLSTEPEQTLVDAMMAGKYDEDEFIIVGKNAYVFCPNGYGRTKLNNNFFENKLKVSATTRNWKTVNELFTMADV